MKILWIIFLFAIAGCNSTSNSVETVYDKSSVSKVAVVKKRVEPAYPLSAYRNQIYKGYVISSLTIDKNGNVKNIELVEYSKGGFAKSAKEALKQWKYTPASLNGKAVNSVLTVRLDWQVENP